MRIVKKHDERRGEILDAAEKLFHSVGYEGCSVNDILKEVGIAKGTFYHYFKSKEEAMDAVIERNVEIIMERVRKVTEKEVDNPLEKLMGAFQAMRMEEMEEEGMLEDLHRPDNALLHQKSLSKIVDAMAPVLQEIIEEGIEKGAWNCQYPLQYMQIYLAAALTLTDEGIFETDEENQQQLMVALISLLEKILEVPEGQFLGAYLREWRE